METTAKKQNETFKVKGSWDVQSKELKKKFPKLTDSDLKFETGKEEQLLKSVQSRLGKTREEVINIINEFQPEKV
ncbi:MAG TPA: hypothetical protein VK589_13260 [Chryseolinea sp.]|nr:hypothetical protein [Chryseolinea sp.]